MSSNKDDLKFLLTKRLNDYDAIVIAEDDSTYMYGIVDIVQQVNVELMLPIYIAKTTSQLAMLKNQLDGCGLRAIYILDNKYTIEAAEPTGQELIALWHIESDSILITSSYREILKGKPAYPVFDKINPTFDFC
ncbi:hypothetical protein [Fastidiosibacter lacustris]|uniref:hypothetical protein n=1 Tax=Fastidiosibacter lacustris TaxID=2056695 RepID=UPI000E354D59|nr:hypothetical protein [Fastidiosibacter lacustris]